MLHKNGELKYYKELNKYKGKITLNKDTKVRKTAKNQIEIPHTRKTYVLIEVDKKDQYQLPQNIPVEKGAIVTNDIDKWIEAMDTVIQNL